MEGRTNSIHIDAPPEVAFDCVKNPRSFNELMPGVTFTDIAMTRGGIGTRYRFETRVVGIPVKGSGEFTEVEVNRRIHDETSIGLEGSFDWTFEPEDDGVRVTIEHHPGRLWNVPLVGRLLADSYARTDRLVLERLKVRLESGDGTGP
jgi:carbon monoxide dehydrogenase subunit G